MTEQQQRVRARLQLLAGAQDHIAYIRARQPTHEIDEIMPDIARDIRSTSGVSDQHQVKGEHVPHRHPALGRVRGLRTPDKAARVIQAAFRGMQVRKSLKDEILKSQGTIAREAARMLQRWWRKLASSRMLIEIDSMRRLKAISCIGEYVKSHFSRKNFQIDYHARERAATLVQTIFRSSRVRKLAQLYQMKRQTDACIKIQRAWREYRLWIELIQEEEENVVKQALVYKRRFLKDLVTNFSKRTLVAELRSKLLEDFHESTTVIGRKRILDNERLKQERGRADVLFSESEVLNLHAKKQDSNEVELKLQEFVLRKLQTLDFSDLKMKLIKLPHGLQANIDDFSALTNLNISCNQLSGLPLQFFNLTNLTVLKSHQNELKSLLPELYKLKSLQILWLHQNKLRSLPSTIGQLQSLRQITLEENLLEELPTHFIFMTSLKEIRLQNNPFLSPPGEIMLEYLRRGPGGQEYLFSFLSSLHTIHSNHLRLCGFHVQDFPYSIKQKKFIKSIDLTDNRVTEIPDSIFDLIGLNALTLDRNLLTRIPKSIKSARCLRQASFAENNITDDGLPIPTLCTLSSLQELRLTGNQIKNPPPEILKQSFEVVKSYLITINAVWKRSRVLRLPSLGLKSLPRAKGFGNLIELILDDNLLRELPQSILSMRLTSLSLSNNMISSIPEEIAKLSSLRRLDLSVNNLDAIPANMCALADLNSLNLRQNQIRYLPDNFSDMMNLRALILTYNRLSELPPSFSRISSLWDLELAYNDFQNISDSFRSMTNLKRVNLNSNRLLTFPKTLSNCLELESLSANSNQLKIISSGSMKFPAMKEMNLSQNSLEVLPSSIQAMVSLRVLRLESNNLKVFDEGICSLILLERIDLSRNFIRSIPSEILGLTNLTALEMSQNCITSLSPEIRFLTKLEHLILADNLLKYLPPFPPCFSPVLGLLESLRELDLQRNQLSTLPLDMSRCTNLTSIKLQSNSWELHRAMKNVVDPEPGKSSGTLFLTLVKGENLARMDGIRGLSDPFVKIAIADKTFCSHVARGTLDPSWKQTFLVEVDHELAHEEMVFSVFDWDLDGSDDFMGSFRIQLSPQRLDEWKAAEPDGLVLSWHPLQGTDDNGMPAQGRVQVGMRYVANDGTVDTILAYLKRLQLEGGGRATQNSSSGPA